MKGILLFVNVWYFICLPHPLISSYVWFIVAELWDKYSSVFDSVWVATAFKGATGSCQLLPVIQHHLSNHEHWLRVLSREVSKFQHFRGVALTGWSR
jgi:hexosaminidase